MLAPTRKQETVLGFDFGTRRIGVAVGETVTGSARALKALATGHSGTPPWPDITALFKEWRPGRIVVGLPRHLDGRVAPLAEPARAFAAELARLSNCPVVLWDEALSTEAARSSLTEQRQIGAGRSDRDTLNAQAACEILQGWLAGNRHD